MRAKRVRSNVQREKGTKGEQRIMKSVISHYRAISVAVVGMIIGHGQSAWAGWSGSMNGSGYGKAQVNVTSSTLKSNTVATTVTNFPSAFEAVDESSRPDLFSASRCNAQIILANIKTSSCRQTDQRNVSDGLASALRRALSFNWRTLLGIRADQLTA